MQVSLENISVSFGENNIISDVNLTIEDNDRIGFIGVNGSGKSTLINVICKHIKPDMCEHAQAVVHHSNQCTIGLLEQNSGLSTGNTIIEEMKLVYTELIDAKKQLDEMHIDMELLDHNSEEYHTMTEKYAKLQTHFEHMDGYNIEVKIKTILNGMGFIDKAFDTPINILSGGEKTRLALAKLLLENPTLLILDEPTNHLDFKTLMWLEEYLLTYKGSILVVSHDRYFLDKMVTKIWELEQKQVHTYKGNYSSYKIQRQQRVEREEKEYKAYVNTVASMTEYVNKNLERASTSNMAKSRRKQLEKLEEKTKPITNLPTPIFRFEYDKNPIKDVLTVEGLTLRVGEEQKQLCPILNFNVERGDKIALIGENGVGKSTLLKALVGMQQQEGMVRFGANTKVSYYEQENKTLDHNNTPIDELWGRHRLLKQTEIRTILGNVLISGEQVFQRIGTMSGGQRAKVAFSTLILERGNVLILDEPTNHLDLQSKESLEIALNEFDGTLLMVSHDRYFLNKIPSIIFEMTKEGLNIYKGNYDFYMQNRVSTTVAKAQPTEKTQTGQKEQFHRSKEQRKKEVARNNQLKQLMERSSVLEKEIEELELEISSNKLDYQALTEMCETLELKKSENEAVVEEWLELSEE